MSYFLARDGQQHGPYETDAVRRMVAEGSISQKDLLWTEGMAAWTPVSEIFPVAAPPPPPPPIVTPPPPPFAPPAAAVIAPAPFSGAGPIPSSMHWFVVMLLGSLTMGIFAIVWAFKIAGFVKKISPHRNGRGLLFAILALDLLYMLFFGLVIVAIHTGHWDRRVLPNAQDTVTAIGFLLAIVESVMAISAFFRMRRVMLDYYNSTEPIRLRLSGAMTFFFSIYYLQYHLRRIAIWKKTGQLIPPAQ
jgi:hypothetical protein